MSEEKKADAVVEEKEVKKSAKKSEEVKAEVKVAEPKKEVKEVKVTNVKKEFVVGAKVVDKKKRQFTIHSFPEGELHDLSNIVLKNADDVLSIQVKGKLQLV